ncbi:tetratricopeptide repeat protein [Lusitaniella coriacea]|uniref:tetratricopeptide repeat protein n=1 Tax=Lusitaniella coriacea TaxID=1983105 RepID=UPI003CEA66CB
MSLSPCPQNPSLPLSLSGELFGQLDLDLDSVPLENLADYSAVYYFLMLEDEPPTDAGNLEKVHRYLEAFHHLQSVRDWNRALKVLIATPDPRMEEELHNLLGIWGYSQQQAEIYQTLLYQVNAQCDTTCLNGLGHFCDTIADYDRAIEYHQPHLQLAREIGDSTSEWLALTGLGNACESKGQIESAIAPLREVRCEDWAMPTTFWGTLSKQFSSLSSVWRLLARRMISGECEMLGRA